VILYPATLLKVFYDVLSYLSFYNFVLSFAMSRNPKTILNKSGESGHPCLILDFRGNGFSFSPFSMMLAIVLSYIAFIMLNTFLLFPLLSRKDVEFY
jgi:hypothetical protein